ncbi:hypothetical protein OC844_003403 [Tilletia horrida]|nr:hypothetical protein OC844_003403 [Tilletia horrida]
MSFLTLSRSGLASPTSARFFLPASPTASTTFSHQQRALAATSDAIHPSRLSAVDPDARADNRTTPSSGRQAGLLARFFAGPTSSARRRILRLAEVDPEPHTIAVYLSNDLLPRLYPHIESARQTLTRWAAHFPTLTSLALCTTVLGPSGTRTPAQIAQTAVLFALPTHLRNVHQSRKDRVRSAASDWFKAAEASVQAIFLPLALQRSPALLASLARTLFVSVPSAILDTVGRGLVGLGIHAVKSRYGSRGPGGARWAQALPVILAGGLFVGADVLWDWVRSSSPNGSADRAENEQDAEDTACIGDAQPEAHSGLEVITNSSTSSLDSSDAGLVEVPTFSVPASPASSATVTPYVPVDSALLDEREHVSPSRRAGRRRRAARAASSTPMSDSGNLTPLARQHILGFWIDLQLARP